MRNRLVLLLATVSGVAVGNVYFPQSLTPAVAAGLHVSPGGAATVITAAQAGYTAGLFLLVPLGDRVPRSIPHTPGTPCRPARPTRRA